MIDPFSGPMSGPACSAYREHGVMWCGVVRCGVSGEDETRCRDKEDPGEPRQPPGEMQHDGVLTGDLAVVVNDSWWAAKAQAWILYPVFVCPEQTLRPLALPVD